MNRPAPLIGFDRYVEIAWCVTAMEVAVERISIGELREIVAETLPGKESQRKTIDVLRRLWINPFPQLTDFMGRGLGIYRRLGKEYAPQLCWGSAIATYPFYAKTAEITGRLFALQGDCSIREIQRRIAEIYGERDGIERAVARILQSQANWGMLCRDDAGKRVVKVPSWIVDDDELTTWMIEASIRSMNKPLLTSSLQSLAVLFPFTFSQPLLYIVSKSANLQLRPDGPANQVVALA